ncbi:MAG TPA: ketol-acid reductoisomerase [Thermoplasmata archaeon]|nr:ketol-acid reductoisomerase [Thermoplasmata archaeon]
MGKLYHEKDASLDVLKNKKVAVIGYGNQGSAQAQNLKDSGVDVVVGLREGPSWKRATDDGMRVLPVDKATREADIVHILLPDEVQSRVYDREIKDNLESGNTLSFSHGFNITFKCIEPPDYVDVIMIAPKAPGYMVRKLYQDGFGTPALIAVEQNVTGKAKDIALAMAKAMHFTKAGVLETTFYEESTSDLFGEQAVLCGGVSELIKSGFNTLVDAGYQPELAYFECMHELKLITDLFYRGGMEFMWKMVSNTAEYGGRTRGKRVVNEQSKREMGKILDDIKSGKFAEEWIKESTNGMQFLQKARKEDEKEEIEIVGKKIRELFTR